MTSDIAVLSRPLPSGEGWAPACLAELHCSGTVETWPSEKRQPGSGSMQGTGQLGILPLDLAPKITPRAPRMKASPAHPVGGGGSLLRAPLQQFAVSHSKQRTW